MEEEEKREKLLMNKDERSCNYLGGNSQDLGEREDDFSWLLAGLSDHDERNLCLDCSGKTQLDSLMDG